VTVEWLFSAIVFAALGIIVIVVVVGGIVCIKDDTYTFAEYLTDLSGLWTVLGSALLGTLGRALTPLIARWAATPRP
jgi:hypothetical protein